MKTFTLSVRSLCLTAALASCQLFAHGAELDASTTTHPTFEEKALAPAGLDIQQELAAAKRELAILLPKERATAPLNASGILGPLPDAPRVSGLAIKSGPVTYGLIGGVSLVLLIAARRFANHH